MLKEVILAGKLIPAKFLAKTNSWKLILAQVFPCEFCEISKNTFFL